MPQKEAAVGKLFDEAAFLEFEEHLEEGAAIGFADVKAAGEVLEGDGVISKLKKTKDIVGTEVQRARHGGRPFLGAKGVHGDFSHFFAIRRNFFAV